MPKLAEEPQWLKLHPVKQDDQFRIEILVIKKKKLVIRYLG